MRVSRAVRRDGTFRHNGRRWFVTITDGEYPLPAKTRCVVVGAWRGEARVPLYSQFDSRTVIGYAEAR